MGNSVRDGQTSKTRSTVQSQSQEATDIIGKCLSPRSEPEPEKISRAALWLTRDVWEGEEGAGARSDTVHLECTTGQPQGKKLGFFNVNGV